MKVWELVIHSQWRHPKVVSQLVISDLQTIFNDRGLLQLSSSSCNHVQYDFGRRSSSVTVRRMYDTDNEKELKLRVQHAVLPCSTPVYFGKIYCDPHEIPLQWIWFGNKCNRFFTQWVWFPNQFGNKWYTRACDYAALDTSNLLVIRVLMVYTLML